MKRGTLITLLILVNISIIFYINFKIETDLSYHSGKDGGIFTGLEMITVLSAFYFLILSKSNKLIFFIIGFFVGIFSFLISYFTIYYSSISENDIYFYLFAMILFMASFHLIERQRTMIKLKRDNSN